MSDQRLHRRDFCVDTVGVRRPLFSPSTLMPLIIHSFNSYLLYTHNLPGTVPSSRARPVNQADHETNQEASPSRAWVTLNGKGR